jgi:hypothetical protein
MRHRAVGEQCLGREAVNMHRTTFLGSHAQWRVQWETHGVDTADVAAECLRRAIPLPCGLLPACVVMRVARRQPETPRHNRSDGSSRQRLSAPVASSIDRAGALRASPWRPVVRLMTCSVHSAPFPITMDLRYRQMSRTHDRVKRASQPLVPRGQSRVDSISAR